MKTYDQMLKEALKKLSKDVDNKVRLDIPKPQIIIQGNHTIISNFLEIATKIRRDPKHLAKFLFKELAIPGNIDGSRLLLQGKAYQSLVEKKLETYMKEFVYCKECNRPDTKLEKEGRIYLMKCEACGAKQPVRKI